MNRYFAHAPHAWLIDYLMYLVAFHSININCYISAVFCRTECTFQEILNLLSRISQAMKCDKIHKIINQHILGEDM